MIAGIFSIVGGFIYLLFAREEIQPWALESQETEVDPEKKSLMGKNDEAENSNSHFDTYGSIPEKKTLADV